MKRILLSLLAICAMSAAFALENIQVGNTTRTIIAYAPQNLPQNRPLVIACHGANQDAPYLQNASKWESVADTAKFVVVYANGVNKMWDISGTSDLQFMEVIINTMYERYKIDRNRVYLTGFSMGGMFTYYAATKMADKIAAFAPVSGYPMGGPNATASRPVPILHTHGTGDDVCVYSNVQSHINAWVAFNGCDQTPEVIQPYPKSKPNSPASMKRYKNGRNGVEVALLTLAEKGHWWSMDPAQALTSEEVWNFCKRYSLQLTAPQLRLVSPTAGSTITCFTADRSTAFPSLTLDIEASDPNGTIAQVNIYKNSKLIAHLTEPPYTYTINAPALGTHKYAIIATDNDGEKSNIQPEVTLAIASGEVNLSQNFTEGGVVPAGWVTGDGNEERKGRATGFTSGCRVLQLTGSPRAFDYALYIRNVSGATHAGYARYGAEGSLNVLRMTPARYALRYRICNWNCSSFSPVTIAIERVSDGQIVASQVYTPSVNVGNSVANAFSGVQERTFTFDITEADQYAVTIYTADAAWADAFIGGLALEAKEYYTAGIHSVEESPLANDTYSLDGRRLVADGQRQGLCVKNGRTVFVK